MVCKHIIVSISGHFSGHGLRQLCFWFFFTVVRSPAPAFAFAFAWAFSAAPCAPAFAFAGVARRPLRARRRIGTTAAARAASAKRPTLAGSQTARRRMRAKSHTAGVPLYRPSFRITLASNGNEGWYSRSPAGSQSTHWRLPGAGCAFVPGRVSEKTQASPSVCDSKAFA